ncbi:UDP-glucose 4-epimerase family protein [Burkholderia ubonensis]|uniref:UDP-glucose 4-epimerase family protein n=1 Tax=Burkholderia ubonensis TaxID=101571 RepID=UPI000F5649CA|nr:SDR family oxidoreductase [Burkholderia ubonensis]RQP42289.1 NAD-dependent epimerase/dehydratase family protein [Burkholderia ubonensis]RQP42545.1 NAD-dependent epimerase/dehydratase family protein [Burkholderia ubonensis]RQP45792.1 NAD-dependent epimerase/dehydratase family protein [Burkholderia ubonensis]RQP56155.1 NAD-dependent epimerase/dehydratase family protein [Burkholderia ubonensis]RQP63093.1 NAD-dependent epimerase/dehydratase family protein [Burkholderia ubonensis]
MTRNILVTGANGFVGRAVCRLALAAGHTVTALVRRPGGCIPGVREWVHDARDFDGIADAWPADLHADCIIHLAARVHVMHDESPDPDAAFDATNVAGTLRIARAARAHGVSRLVYVSSIKAVGEGDKGAPLTEEVAPAPQDAYGRSKLRAERELAQFGETAGLDVVIVRPPLVYGPDVRANFLRMMDAVSRGTPLPLGAITARRSLVYVDNLADALLHCANDPHAARGCFHIADDNALSVAELLCMLGDVLGKPARLFSIPVGMLRAAGKLTGRGAAIDRLTGSLQLDTSHIKRVLGWQPPYSTRQGLEATAAWYRSRDTRQ